MNAAGLRDTPVRAYAREDAGSDGFSVPVFRYTAEWWGRIDESRASVSRMQDRLQMKLDAVGEFADEAVIPTVGLLKDVTDGRCWRIEGINSVRLLQRLCVGLTRISDDEFTTFTLYEAASPLDGTHLVEP